MYSSVQTEPDRRLHSRRLLPCVLLSLLASAGQTVSAQPTPAPTAYSGIYPHLAMFGDSGEAGTGAVVSWADRLWTLTYAPHSPRGSNDKLYEITPDLGQIIRRESVGGTPANRMIHRESNQLFIGPYIVDAERRVRVIPPSVMLGRLTGNARHLTDPANKIYYATMEEGFYEVDVHSLAVTELYPDGNHSKNYANELLPGYHGKGLYSGQGRLIYANNGEKSSKAERDPTTESGVLAEWAGKDWKIVRRNQFTEITGPGGIEGSAHPETDPIWSIGWDYRSLILMVLDQGAWRSYRLPKGSHSYDGAHGWNTEWPRIRDIGESDLLMTMHGTFWKFPRTFAASSSVGVIPRSNYLKVVGDFAPWQGKVVLGTDDTARSEFLNKRKAKGVVAAPGRSQSNLWFLDYAQLDSFGPPIGRGAVWLDDAVAAGAASDPYLFSGYARRALFVSHDSNEPVTFRIEVDVKGDGRWTFLRDLVVPARGSNWTEFTAAETGAWVRLVADRASPHTTAFFHYRAEDMRPDSAAPLAAGLAADPATRIGGLLHTGRSELRFLATNAGGEIGAYELSVNKGALRLAPSTDAKLAGWLRTEVAVPEGVLSADAASLIYADDRGRWRLPRGHAEAGVDDGARVCREVATERDLFNAGGIFYELPAENAGGFAKVRAVSTHNIALSDYTSFRGLLVISGVATEAPAGPHIIRSEDGRAALWVGGIDDIWSFGKARGVGGPWKDSAVKANTPSDPYLMTGFDQKEVVLSHTGNEPVTLRLEADIAGDGRWTPYRSFTISPGATERHAFPDAFSAYWIRVVADHNTIATVQFIYR